MTVGSAAKVGAHLCPWKVPVCPWKVTICTWNVHHNLLPMDGVLLPSVPMDGVNPLPMDGTLLPSVPMNGAL